MKTGKIEAFNVNIDKLDMAGAVRECLSVIAENRPYTPFVVTPNVNHIVEIEHNQAMLKAYHKAELVVVDGRPVKFILGLLGKEIPGVVTGSDLVPEIFEQSSKSRIPLRIYLLGAAPGVAEKASTFIQSRWPSLKVVGTCSPPMGFSSDHPKNKDIINSINQAKPDLLVIGLGAPKQEIWISENSNKLNAGLAICAGATIDFLAGNVKRAPLWLQHASLEWLFRIIKEPKRLFPRYFHDGIRFPFICIKEMMGTKRAYRNSESRRLT